MIKSTHFRLLVADVKAEFAFFRDVLGFSPTFGTEDDVYVDFDCNGVSVALFRRDLMSAVVHADALPLAVEAQDRLALIFEVADVDAFCDGLKEKGLSLVTAPSDRAEWGIRVAHFRDPDGNLIEVNQPLKHG